MSQRLDRATEFLRHTLGPLLIQEVELPKNTVVAITNITVSPDLRYATVWLAVTPASEAGVAYGRIKAATAELQRLASEKMDLQFTPKLRWRVDKSGNTVNEIEQLLDQIHHERQ